MIARTSTHRVYQVQRFLQLFFFLVTMISLSIPLMKGILALFPDQLYPLVVGLLLYMAGTVVLAAYLHTLTYIPFHLATAFDPIKNDIAAGEIRSMEALGERLSAFVTEFFDFAFLDIDHAFLHTEEAGIVSNEKLEGPARAMEQFGMLDMSKTLEEIIRAGKVNENGKDYHLYILPIWFGERWLGYMGLMSRRRIGGFHRRFLSEMENNFLDDQVMHIIQITK
jgi:hypothetical protein